MRSRLVAQVAGSIEWRLTSSVEAEIRLGGFPGWYLRNPLCWSLNEQQFAGATRSGKIDRTVVVSTRGLSLAYETEESDDDLPVTAFSVVSEVLRRLRYASRQFSIPSQVTALTKDRTETIAQAEPDRDLQGMFVRNYHVSTAISDEHLRSVSGLGPDFSIPVHAEVLLDALEAHVDEDYRKALLYGTIAVEAFARHQVLRAPCDHLRRVITL